MYKILIWNNKSPNFGANAFVDKNGTSQVEVASFSEAMDAMDDLSAIAVRMKLLDPDGKKILDVVCLKRMKKDD